jgi:hypothetical protein
MSWLSVLGSDVGKVFRWLGSPKAQKIIGGIETVAEIIDPALDGVFAIMNTWGREILTAQAFETAVGSTPYSNAQKSAMVLSTMTPQILAFAAAQKLPIPDAAGIQKANDALVAFLNAFEAPATPAIVEKA